MRTLFVSGSISTKEIAQEVSDSLVESRERGYRIILGDASGIDRSIQMFLKAKHFQNVEVFHIDKKPRNFADESWGLQRVPINQQDKLLYKNGRYTRQAQMVKDKAMAEQADIGLVVWQDLSRNRFGKNTVSKGSLHNIINLLRQNKYVGLYYCPRPDLGIMKFHQLDDFERQVIDVLVAPETRNYYYKMKEQSIPINKLKNVQLSQGQLSLF